jgi:hypothetical protein
MALANLVSAKTWFSPKWETTKVYSKSTFYSIKETFRFKRTKQARYAFFGEEHDLELVEYLFKVILAAIDTEAKRFKFSEAYHNASGSRKSAYVSFQKGMALRIADRLLEIKKQNDAELESAKSTGRALMVLKNQLMEQEFDKEGIKLRSTYYSGGIKDVDAYFKGIAAGDKVNLSRPISKKEPTGYLT